MILVLEGAMGAGKSTLARLLAEQIHWPIYRAFREEGDGHKPGATQEWIKLVKLPVNTWLEDMYVADICATLKPDLILDRSMPSAVAYETLNASNADEWHKLRHQAQRNVALSAWAGRMRVANCRIVLLKGVAKTLSRRAGSRASEAFVQREQDLIETCANATGLPVLVLRRQRGNRKSDISKDLKKVISWIEGRDSLADVG
jgi:predicted ATPase